MQFRSVPTVIALTLLLVLSIIAAREFMFEETVLNYVEVAHENESSYKNWRYNLTTTDAAKAGQILAAPSPIRADYSSAVSAYENGAYEAARREFQALAQNNDIAAQYYLGLMFKNGLGVPRDPVAALGWFLCAAKSDSQVGRDAARWAEQLSSALDGASVSAAQEKAGSCRAAKNSERPDASEASKRPNSRGQSAWRDFVVELDQIFQELSQVEIVRPEIGASPDRAMASEPPRSSSGPLFAVPSRRTVWSKVFFLPADGTVVGSQHVARELGANDFFRDLTTIARDGNDIALGVVAVLWWLLIGKALLSVGRALTSVFRRSGAE